MCCVCAANKSVCVHTHTHTHTRLTHHESIGGTHTVEAVVEGSKLFIDGFIQQEVDVELHVLCGRRRKHTNSVSSIIPLQTFTTGRSEGRWHRAGAGRQTRGRWMESEV